MHTQWAPAPPRQPRPDTRQRKGRRRVLARLTVIFTLLSMVFFGAKWATQSLRTVGQPGAVQLQTAEQKAPTEAIAAASAVPSGYPGALDAKTSRKAASRLAPDLPLPDSFLASHAKTPCWSGVMGESICLPSFLLAGGFQTGAGTLAAKLAAHPNVKTGPSSNTQFWGEYAKPISEYLAGFSEAVADMQPETDMLMDNSQSTFSFYWAAGGRTHTAFRSSMEACWSNCSEAAAGDADKRDACVGGKCFMAAQAEDRKAFVEAGIASDDAHVPLLLHAAYGDWPVRLVVVLRNPIERLEEAYWSYGHYRAKYGETAVGFAAYVNDQVAAFEACTARHSSSSCALKFESLGIQEEQLFFHADQLIRGMYGVFLTRWLRHVPRERILLIRSEEYFNDNEKTVRQVLKFLGLQPPEDMGPMLQAGKPQSGAKGAPAMLPATRERLQKFYAPFNEELSKVALDTAYLNWNGEEQKEEKE